MVMYANEMEAKETWDKKKKLTTTYILSLTSIYKTWLSPLKSQRAMIVSTWEPYFDIGYYFSL